jgi:hypothetical protein
VLLQNQKPLKLQQNKQKHQRKRVSNGRQERL